MFKPLYKQVRVSGSCGRKKNALISWSCAKKRAKNIKIFGFFWFVLRSRSNGVWANQHFNVILYLCGVHRPMALFTKYKIHTFFEKNRQIPIKNSNIFEKSAWLVCQMHGLETNNLLLVWFRLLIATWTAISAKCSAVYISFKAYRLVEKTLVEIKKVESRNDNVWLNE